MTLRLTIAALFTAIVVLAFEAGRASALGPAPVIPAADAAGSLADFGYGEPDQGRTGAPVGTSRAPTPPSSAPRSAAGTLSGVATWYRWPGLVGAAGPALRQALGPHWRGQTVRVCSGSACVTVRLSDWCACAARHGRPTLLDLSDGAFRALAALSRGVVAVEVGW